MLRVLPNPLYGITTGSPHQSINLKIYTNSSIPFKSLFVCMCFSGLFCEFSPPMVLPRTSPCDNHECFNGAQCVVMGSDPRCQCLHGYEGERCETLVSVNFVSRESYLQLPSNLLSPETNISLQVKGIVLYLRFLFKTPQDVSCSVQNVQIQTVEQKISP